MSQKSIKPEQAIRAWVNRAIIDFYAAFELENLFRLRLFFLHQGIEKLCKAYLIGTHGYRYENLDANKAGKWIDEFSKSLGHDLHLLLGFVVIGVPQIIRFVKNERFIDLMMKGYEEGRYPRPIAKSFWKRPGLSAMISDRTDKLAFILGGLILTAIEEQFNIKISIDRPLANIRDKQCARFVRIWESRTKTKTRVAN